MRPTKTRNNGEWTEARYVSFVKSLLRAGSRKWGPNQKVKKDARVGRGQYKCSSCGEIVPPTLKGKHNIFVDHVIPATDIIEGFTSWDDFIERLFCEEDNLQLICHECHSKKSKAESESRRKQMGWPSLTPEYNSWRSMRARCLFKSHAAYKNYGGRGITICDRWVDSFENFVKDMGPRPEGTTLDRIDVNKGYYKENCRWASMTEQANNKRNTVLIDFDGESKTISQWSKDLGIPTSTIMNRLAGGYSSEDALSKNFKNAEPVKSKMSEKEFIDHFNKSSDIDDLVDRTGRKKSTCTERLRKLGLKFKDKKK